MLDDVESVNLGVSGAVTADLARRLNQTNVRSNVKSADVIVLHRGKVVAHGPVKELRAMMQSEASLEGIISQLVTTVDPERTARDIADIVGRHA